MVYIRTQLQSETSGSELSPSERVLGVRVRPLSVRRAVLHVLPFLINDEAFEGTGTAERSHLWRGAFLQRGTNVCAG